MDEFDKAAAMVVGDPMDAAAGMVVDNQRTNLRSSLYSTLGINPDEAARAKQLGQKTGLPADLVRRNYGEVERRAKLDEFDDVLNNSPVLAKWLSYQGNASVAHDNVANMGEIERKIRQVGGGLVDSIGTQISGAGVLADILQRTAINDFSTMFLPEPKRGPLGLEPSKPTIESLAGTLIGQGFQASGGLVKDYARQNIAGIGEKTFADQVAGGIGQVVGQAATYPIMRGLGLYAQGADAMNDKVKGDNADQRTKDLAVLGGAAVTGVTEAWALDKLLGPMAMPVKNQIGAALARIGIGAAAEGGQELSENVLQDTIRKALTNRDAEINIGQSVQEGGVGAAVGGIVRTAVEAALHIKTRGDRKVQQAEQGAQAVEELHKLVAADKLLQRDPQSFEQFVKEASQDSPVQHVYIDAKTLMQSGVAEQVAQVSPTVAEQLQVAAELGAQIAIPVEEYAARIAPTDFAQSLIDHIKTEPDGFSRAEAQDYMQTQGEKLQQYVDQALAEKEADTTFQKSKESVKAQIQQELDTLGRFTPQKNEADATLFSSYYAVRAAQLGVTPEELYAKRKLNFAAESLGGQELNQVAIDTPEFANWFGDSKVVDAQGKPLVVYHGTNDSFTKVNFKKGAQGLFWFASDRSSIESGEAGAQGTKKIMELYAKIENPAGWKEYDKYSTDELRGMGYDGVILPESDGSFTGFIFKNATQVKSATKNRGTFDPNDPNILNQGARGAFSPESLVISLLKGADLSTNLHEGAHFFFENDIALASEIASESAKFGPDTLSDGERQILTDVSTLLKWHGIKGTIDEQLAQWHTMDFEQVREAHERTAESFEAYLFDGKAPSIELQSYFQKFRAWMLSVYKSLKSFLEKNPEAGKLDDTVRAVFDRMLATTEQIKLAEQSRSMMPLFTDAATSGMTPQEFELYQRMGFESTAEAIDHLQARGMRDLAWTRNARGREIKKLQKKAAALRSETRIEARKEILSQPVYQAWQFLTSKEGGKIYLNPTDPNISLESSQKLDEYKMTATDGAHPDILAEQFGFTSGDELIQALTAAVEPEAAIEDLTDKRMMERNGELATPEAIEYAADQAIHNEARARMVATEANVLLRAQGDRRVLFEAAREFAAQVVARLKVRDLQPSRYANAAARAGVNAEKASKAGDIATAAAEKRNQVVQNFAAKATYDARDEVERAVKYLRKFDRKGTRENLDAGYLEQIDALLSKFDLSSTASEADRKASLKTWVLSRLNAGEVPAISEALLTPSERAKYLAEVQSRDDKGDLVYKDDDEAVKLLADAIDNSAQRSHKDMSVEEFRGLVDTVKNIEHLARLKNKLLTSRKEKAYEAVRDEIAGAIVTNAKQKSKNTKTANDWLGRKIESLKDFGASHIKVATWARIMDGGIDDGPVWRYLVQPANERATMETTMRAEATAALDKIMRPLLSKVSIMDKSGKGKHFPTLGRSLNWQERFAMALNIGNESNMQRLLGGDGWRFDQIKPVLDTLSAEEWLAVQKVWDHFETYRPLIAEKEKRVTGKEPEWIQARQIQVQTSDGQSITLRGGYYPVVFDPRVNMKAEADSKSQEAKDLMKAAYSAATTRRGFTKQRVDELHGRPLLLNLQGLYSGVNDVIHDLAWHEWVIDANKLLKSKTIDNAIREHYGPEVKKQFDKWRDDIVMGSRRMDHAIEKGAAFLRQGVSASALTFNLLSAAMQPLGLANSVARVGPKWIGVGVSKYAGSPFDTTREVMEKSKWMTNRTRTRFRELNELRNQVQGQTAAKELMGRYGYWLMMRTQLMVDVPTWWGAYERAIAEAHDEQTAIQLADQSVKDAQGGGEEVDQSGIERGGPLTKLFTAFYGFMGTTLNTAYLAGKSDKNRARATANVLLVVMTPAILGSLLKDALQPGGDDEDELFKKLAAEQVSFLLGMVAFGREFSGIAKAAMGEGAPSYSGPAGVRMIPDTGKLVQQASQGEFDQAFLRSFISVLGDLTGIPAVQINRTIQGYQAVQDDKVEGPVESAAGLAFGFQR
jgi:hypothetical protein